MPTSASVAPAGTFAALLERRGNSFGFLRCLLAVVVIVSHAWTLSGHGSEALAAGTRETAGRLAVYGFFALSGFLIAHSYASSGGLLRFLWHRALRILPGFYGCLLVTALVFAGVQQWVEHGSVAGHGAAAWTFWTANQGVRIHAYGIGDTLADHPFPRHWVGALWTLIYELKCYLLAALLGVLGLLRRWPWLLAALWLASLAALVVETLAPGRLQAWSPVWIDPPLIQFVPCFLAGMTAWRWRERIRAVDAVAVGLALAAVAVLWWQPRWFTVAAVAVIPYLTLYLSLRLPLRDFERRGDLSYGIYLYGFPVQQLLVTAGAHHLGYAAFALLSVVATLPFAAASWFGIERPLLRLKGGFRPRA